MMFSAGPSWSVRQFGKPPEPKLSDEESDSVDRYQKFVDFCKSELARLGLHDLEDLDFFELWKEAAKYSLFSKIA